jgi:hypothetical protein
MFDTFLLTLSTIFVACMSYGFFIWNTGGNFGPYFLGCLGFVYCALCVVVIVKDIKAFIAK